ncbi:head-tail adaptor [Gordonia phage Gsput1]|uniref:Head-to-tail adaptor n=1 Tax=Gordonia phage Gsput1 TaxID=1622193 RepID=A0A0E3T891_9CAUD|nr:head-tail adaptor [Gordonia phage Gsput1]AKC03035.1 hypothetical protein Gsput1_10 [Gordonia phage Gsput1]
MTKGGRVTITPNDLAEFTGGQVDPDAPGVQRLIDGALDVIRTYCGWHVLGEIRETLTLNGSGLKDQELPTTHVVEVHEVVEDGELVPSTAYRWSADGALRKRVGVWLDEFRAVEVTLTHGFERQADVELVALQLASRIAANPLGLRNEAVGAMTFGHGGSGVMLLDDEYVRLDPFRAVV